MVTGSIGSGAALVGISNNGHWFYWFWGCVGWNFQQWSLVVLGLGLRWLEFPTMVTGCSVFKFGAHDKLHNVLSNQLRFRPA